MKYLEVYLLQFIGYGISTAGNYSDGRGIGNHTGYGAGYGIGWGSGHCGGGGSGSGESINNNE